MHQDDGGGLLGWPRAPRDGESARIMSAPARVRGREYSKSSRVHERRAQRTRFSRFRVKRDSSYFVTRARATRASDRIADGEPGRDEDDDSAQKRRTRIGGQTV